MKTLPVSVFLIFLCLICKPAVWGQASAGKTKVVILGVGHTVQLVAEANQPAAYRAFFKRVSPDALCIERSPQEFARNDFYEFTYEQQYLIVPFAKENKIPLCPIDWLPAPEDTMLAFNLADLEKPPFVRRASGFMGFTSFPDKETLEQTFFYADAEADRRAQREFAETIPADKRFDFARRLYLYRTFMQAMRIARAAADNRGKTVLVVIGSLHKNDIEEILKTDENIEIIQPSAYGAPASPEIEKEIRREDLFAVAVFNLLGMQAKTGNIKWDWLARVIAQLEREKASAETALLKTRFLVLQNKITAAEALAAYRKAFEAARSDEQFTWTGVKDRARLDSFFDPFGNLTVKQRTQIEIARESYKLKQTAQAEAVKQSLMSALSVQKARQMDAYWDEFVLKMN